MLFLRQSFSSNFCGVYSTAMLLSAMGRKVDRKVAFRLFDLPPHPRNYGGASLDNIAQAVNSATGAEVDWIVFDQFRYGKVRSALRANAPTIISFGARYGRLTCIHAVVGLGVDVDGIALLDPLGRAPKSPQSQNCLIDRAGVAHGVRYSLRLATPVSIMRWSRPA